MAPPGMMMEATNLVISEAVRISEVKKQPKKDTPPVVVPTPKEFSEKKEKTYIHKKYAYSYKWLNIFVFGYIHLTLLYCIYIHCFAAKWQTVAFSIPAAYHFDDGIDQMKAKSIS